MRVPSYTFHSFPLKLPNKLKKGREKYSKIILFISFHSIPFPPPKKELNWVGLDASQWKKKKKKKKREEREWEREREGQWCTTINSRGGKRRSKEGAARLEVWPWKLNKCKRERKREKKAWEREGSESERERERVIWKWVGFAVLIS